MDDCTLGAAPSTVLVGTTSADSSREALPSLSSPAAALVEHTPATGKKKKIRPSSAGAPSPALHEDPRELSPSWAPSPTNTPNAAAAAFVMRHPFASPHRAHNAEDNIHRGRLFAHAKSEEV